MNSLTKSLESHFSEKEKKDIVKCQRIIKKRFQEIKNINKITNICYNSIYSIIYII